MISEHLFSMLESFVKRIDITCSLWTSPSLLIRYRFLRHDLFDPSFGSFLCCSLVYTVLLSPNRESNYLDLADESGMKLLLPVDIKGSIGLKKCMPNGNVQQCQWLSLASSGKHRFCTEEDRLIGQIGWNILVQRGHAQGLMGRRRVNIDSGRYPRSLSLLMECHTRCIQCDWHPECVSRGGPVRSNIVKAVRQTEDILPAPGWGPTAVQECQN